MSARQRLPDRRPSLTFELEHIGLHYTVTISRSCGAVREVFIQNHKNSSASDVAARDCGVLISLCLQHGCPLTTIARALLRNTDGTASGVAGAVIDLLTDDDGGTP
jgi:ribonucleoside-diphosphate reductase alpha chain